MQKLTHIELDEDDIKRIIAKEYGCMENDVSIDIHNQPLLFNNMIFGNSYYAVATVNKTEIKE